MAKQQIEQFLTSDATQLVIPMTPLKDVTEILEELGYDYENLLIDSNHGDFNFNFSNGEVTGHMEGSLWGGNFTLIK